MSGSNEQQPLSGVSSTLVYRWVSSLGLTLIRGALLRAFLFWLKLRKGSANGGCAGREGRFLSDPSSFLAFARVFALVVFAVFGLVRARFNADLAFLRLILFFMIASLGSK
jgi:hypothetical protein